MSAVHTLSGGEIALWSEHGGCVMIKVLSKSPDPVELGEGEVEELISILQKLQRTHPSG